MDNLIKGAGGQAVQAMNLALGTPEETAGLRAREYVPDARGYARAGHLTALLRCTPRCRSRRCRGHGSWLVDEPGNEWLDAYGGHAVASTGHCHPAVVKAIAEQAAKLIFYSTAVPHPFAGAAGGADRGAVPRALSKVFFCNSGAEANENALALARKAHRPRRRSSRSRAAGTGAPPRCLAVHRRRHATRRPARRAGMPLSAKVPFNDIAGPRGGGGPDAWRR